MEQAQGSIFPVKALNNLFRYGKEVVFYALADERLTVTEISDSISVYGYSPEDFTSGKLAWRDVLHPDDYASLRKLVVKSPLTERAGFEHEHRIFTESGEIVWITCVTVPEADATGAITRFLVKIKDISRRKRYEEQLHDANEKLFVTLKSIGEAVIQTDADGYIERLNGAAEKMCGFINLKARNKPLNNVFRFSYDADFSEPVDPLKMRVETCKMVQVDEIFMKCAAENKSYRVSCNVSPIFIGKNKTEPTGYVLVVKDLTAIYGMLRAAQDSEARMQKSESTIRGIFDHSADGMLLTDSEGVVREWSSGYERISGLSKDAVIGKYLWDVAVMSLPPEMQASEERVNLEAELKELVGNMHQKMISRHVVHRKTGEHRILDILYFPVSMPEETMLGAISRDVTEEVRSRKRIEENERKLISERDRLQTLGDNMPNGCLYQFTLNAAEQRMGFTYMSRSWEKITGISVEDAMKDLNMLMSRIHPDDLPVYMQAFEESLADMCRFNVEIRFILDRETTRWGRITSTPHPDGPNVVWDGFIVDITDNKIAEQKITAEKERLQALGDNMPNGCLYRTVTDPQTMDVKFVYLSGTFEHILNMSAETALQDFSAVTAKIHPDDLPGMMRNIAEAAQNRTDYNEEVRFYYNDTDLHWIQISSHPHIEAGLLVYDGFILDITDRKSAENEMIAEKERLEALGDNLPNGCLLRFTLDTQTNEMKLAYVSKTWESTIGVSAEDSLRDISVAFGTVYPDDLPVFMQKIRESAATLENFNVETRIILNNEIQWVNAATHPHREGNLIVWDGFILNINDRKLAEQALLDEKNRLQSLGDNMPDGCLFRFMMNVHTRKVFGFTYLSRTWETLTGTSADDALVDFDSVLARIHPDDLPIYAQSVEESADKMSKFAFEFRFRHANDYTIWLKAMSSPRMEDDMVVWDGFIVDITERKLSEQALIAEKDRLQALGDYFPNGCLFRFSFDDENRTFAFTYLSKTWEKLTNIAVKDALTDIDVALSKLHPDDREALVRRIWETYDKRQENFDAELRFFYTPDELRWAQISTHRHYENGQMVSDGFILDVTERRLAEERLAAEQAKLKSLTDNIPNGCLCQFAINPQTQVMRMAYMSENWERILNSPADASKEDANVVFSKVHEADLPEFMAEVMRTTIEMVPFNVEVRYRYAEDDLRWLQVSGAPHREGAWIIFDGMVMDITDRKKAGQLLLAEKERVETLGNNLPDGSLFRFKTIHETQEMNFEYVSATWERTTGVSAEKSLEDASIVMNRIHPDDMPELGVQLYNSCVDLSNVDAEARYLHPDGSVRWLHIAAHPHLKDGAVISDGFILDITDRKKAEQALLSEKERLQALGDNFPNGTLFRFKMDMQTEQMSFDYVSGTWEKFMDTSCEDSLKDIRAVFAKVHPDDLPGMVERINESATTLNNFNTEIRYIHSDGTRKWFHLSAHPHREDNIVFSDGFILDITERKLVEQQLAAKTEELTAERDRLEMLGKNIPDGCLYRFVLDTQTEKMHMVYLSAAWETVTGVSAEKATEDITMVFDAVHPDDLPRLVASIRESAETMTNHYCEIRIKYQDEHEYNRWLQMASHPQSEGRLISWDGIMLDVTRRKEAEAQVVAEKERLQALGDNMPEGSLFRFKMDMLTEQMSFDYLSGTWEKMSGVSVEDSLADIRNVFARVMPEDLSPLMARIVQSARLLENIDTEIRYCHPDGKMRWYQIASHPHFEEQMVYSDGFILDITARKNAEKALFAEKERLQALGDNFPNGTLFRFKMDMQTEAMSFDYVSGTWEEMLGVPAETALADIRTVFAHVLPADLPLLMHGIRKSADKLENINVEVRYIHPVMREEKWYQISSHPSRNGNIVYSDGFLLDVTARKNAEQELLFEKERLEALGNNIPEGCLYRFTFDPATGAMKMLYVSATWGEVTGVSAERVLADIGVFFEKIYPEDYLRMLEIMRENAEMKSNLNMELRFFLNGETRWAQLISRPHEEENQVVWDGILLDVTWRKETERKLLAEKDRLEAVGNNLPEGSLYRLIRNRDTGKMYMEYVSATWETVTGLSPESVADGMEAYFDIVCPDDLPPLMEATEESERTLTNFKVEIRVTDKGKGGYRWLQIVSHPHIDGNKMVWDGIMTDITRRKEAERELETEKDRLKALGDNIPGGCLYRFILDTRTGQMSVSYVSATWEAVTGVPADTATSDITAVFAAVYPDDVPLLQQAIGESAQTLTNFNCEIRIADHGRPRWVQMASHPHLEDVFVVWDGIILDITRRKEAERELEAEKDRLQALGDNFPGGTLFRFQIEAEQFDRSDSQLWMQHLRLSYASATWEKISNVPLADALQNVSLPFMKIEPEDLARIIPEMYRSLIGLTEFNIEIRYNYTDAEKRWFQIAAVPRREEGMIMVDGFILDITERKNIETELAVYREELERLVKERTEELEATNEELYATNEELYATNEEFSVTNEELHTKNDQLRHEIAARMEIMKKLEDSESKVRNFIRQSFEGIMMLDNEGRIIEWNEALEQITGVSHDEALGKYEWDLLKNYMSEEDRKPEAFEKLRQSRMEYIRNGREQEPIVEESVLYLPDGNKRYLQASMFPIGLAETCFFGRVLRDITEQKLADIELEQYRTQLELMVEQKTQEVVVQQERLVSLSNNLPGGVIYQLMDKSMTESWFTYISGYFADMFEIEAEDAMADVTLFYNSIYPEDQAKLVEFYKVDESQSNIDVEYRIMTKSGKMKWIHMRSSHHSTDDGARVWDGFMIDITARKLAEQELEDTRRRQAILIKVLQIVQSAENLPDALNMSLSGMGKHTGVSRAYIFEKSADGTTVSNTYEWCNEGITPAIDNLQNIPVEYMQQWFDIFDGGEFICTSDIRTLGPEATEALSAQAVKSIVILPLSANGVNYGFVGFDECSVNREWNPSDVELLRSLSQIISTTTRRYRAETTMLLSQQTMRTVLDNVDANIYVADFDSWNILFANKKIKEIMGEDIEGKTCWKVLQEGKTMPCGFCPNPKLRDENNKPTGLYRWEHWNENAKKWYECTDAAIEWVDGRLVHMEYATDITDRKAAEEAVRQSEEMYRQLTVASPDAIVVCDPDGHVRYVSSKALELFGLTENTNVGILRMSRFIHPHDRRQAFGMFGKLKSDNVTFLPQLLLEHNDGSEFIGEVSAATVKDAEGKTTSVIMVIRDITRRKMDEMELIRAKEKAEESDKLKSAFLANMSHEIRTPLNGIVGFLHFLGSDSLSPKRRQEYINVINNSSIQLVKLIDDIIDVAKIEAKQMNIRPVPFRVNDLMNELQVFFETYLQANNKERIALILDDSGFIDKCVTYVDPMRLRQVLTNLIGNAIKFTEKGFIRLGYRQSAPDKLEFVVEDSGIGLATDQLEVIFERFRQAELSNSRQYGGTGLGLTISRSLVQLMGGDMRVESTEGCGSSFYFTVSYLPVASEDEHFFDEVPDEISHSDKPFTGKAVLVVEPEVMKYKYYEQLLAVPGFSVYRAESLQQWLDFISQTNHIDAVIADVSVFEGAESDEIKQIKSVRAGLPVIVIVPEQNDRYRQIIHAGQSNMTLAEPVKYESIMGAMRRFVR